MALRFLKKGKKAKKKKMTKAGPGPKRRKVKARTPAKKARKRPKPKKVKARRPRTRKVKAGPKTAKKPAKPKLPVINKVPDEKAYEIIKRARIPVAPYMFVKDEKGLRRAFKKLGFPLVLKVSGRTIVHKTELNGIRYASNGGAALAALAELMKIKGAEKVLVQKRLSGLELIVGAKASPQFGHVVSLGIGGVYVEILKDVTFRIVPLTEKDAAAMVKELKGYGILAGARGQKPINFGALYDVLMAVGRLAVREKLREMDINPLFCNEDGCWAADVRMVK